MDVVTQMQGMLRMLDNFTIYVTDANSYNLTQWNVADDVQKF